jgi:hypothetical protein
MPLEFVLKRRARAEQTRRILAIRNARPFGPEPEIRPRLLYLARTAKWRAARKGIPFSLTPDDLVGLWPKDNCCPITRLPFSDDDRHPDKWRVSTLDQMRPGQGYVPGNVAVISFRANALKSNVTDPEIFRRLADWLEEVAPSVDSLFS